MTAVSMVDLVMEMGRLDERLNQLSARTRSDFERLQKLIDERIASALAAERAKSLDLYYQGVNGLPQEAAVPASGVNASSRGRRVGLAADSGDGVGQVTHDLAPSRSGEGSVGRSSAASPVVAEDSTPGGAA